MGLICNTLERFFEILERKRIIRVVDLLDASNSYDRKILILDCNSLDDLECIGDVVAQPDLHLIVHMAASHMLNDPAYLSWMRTRVQNPDCIHLYLDESHANVDLVKLYALQAKLNLMNAELFPMLPMQTSQWRTLFEECKAREKALRSQLKIVQGHSGMSFRVKPNLGINLNELAQTIDNRASSNEIFEYFETDPRIKIDGLNESETSDRRLIRITKTILMFISYSLEFM